MPPVAGNEHGLTRVLNALNPVGYHTSTSRSFCFFQSRKDEIKVLDCFIVLSFFDQMLASDQVFVDVFSWWYE